MTALYVCKNNAKYIVVCGDAVAIKKKVSLI